MTSRLPCPQCGHTDKRSPNRILRDARAAAQLTYAETARLCGVPGISSVGRWEREGGPVPKRFAEIVKLLKRRAKP